MMTTVILMMTTVLLLQDLHVGMKGVDSLHLSECGLINLNALLDELAEVLVELDVELGGEGRSVGQLGEAAVDGPDDHDVGILEGLEVLPLVPLHIVPDLFV